MPQAHADKETDKETGKEADKETDQETDKETDNEADPRPAPVPAQAAYQACTSDRFTVANETRERMWVLLLDATCDGDLVIGTMFVEPGARSGWALAVPCDRMRVGFCVSAPDLPKIDNCASLWVSKLQFWKAVPRHLKAPAELLAAVPADAWVTMPVHGDLVIWP